MPHFTKEDLGVIQKYYENNGWQGKRLVSEFPEKGWSARSVNKAIKRLTTKGSIFGKRGRGRPGTSNKKNKRKNLDEDSSLEQDQNSGAQSER